MYPDYDNSSRPTLVTVKLDVAGVPEVSSGKFVFSTAFALSYASLAYASNIRKIVAAYTDGAPTASAFQFTTPYTNKDARIGVSKASAYDGAPTKVAVLGSISDVQQGLTIGQVYYVGDTGALTMTATGNPRIGRAVAENKLLITDGV